MDENLFRFAMVAAFISGMIGIAAVSGELSAYSFSDPFENLYPAMEFSSVSELLDSMPVKERVSVTGTVSHVLEDFTSSSGNEYQQFFISDGSREVKVFCSVRSGRIPVQEGDELFVTGKFQLYYENLEIYSDCSSINHVPD